MKGLVHPCPERARTEREAESSHLPQEVTDGRTAQTEEEGT